VHADWTFTSGHTNPATRSPLGLLDARINLALDGLDAANHAAPLTGNIITGLQVGAPRTRVSTVRVDVSYDDGKTWRPARTKPGRTGTWAVTIPAGGKPHGFASLRLKVADKKGNTLTETITRAYRLS
jgi:hypothetical protein